LNFATTITSTAASSSIYELKQRSIDLNLRTFHYANQSTHDYNKDYLRQIGIYLKGNYSIKRITKNKKQQCNATQNRRSSRNANPAISTIQTLPNNTVTPNMHKVGSVLSGYVRCYVEDFMSLQQNTSIRVLFPSDQNIFEHHEPLEQVQLLSSKFDVFDCVVNTTPNYDWVKQSLTYTDIKHALTIGNYGSYIQVNIF
jgi:hypothetical protein